MKPTEKLDIWLGKTLFVPPIIRICQRLKITQYRFSRWAFMTKTGRIIVIGACWLCCAWFWRPPT